MVEDILLAILTKPETWGGVAAAASYGWWQSERRSARESEHHRAIMDRMAEALFKERKP